MDTGGESIPMGSGTGSAAAVMTVPVRSPLPSSWCPATAASSGTTSGELVGVRGDGALTDDNPLAVPERGEQPDLPAAGVHLGPGAVERLAVQRECGAGRDPPGGEPPGAHLLGQPAPDQDVRLGRVDGGHGAPDRRLARRHEPAGARVPSEPTIRRTVTSVDAAEADVLV